MKGDNDGVGTVDNCTVTSVVAVVDAAVQRIMTLWGTAAETGIMTLVRLGGGHVFVTGAASVGGVAVAAVDASSLRTSTNACHRHSRTILHYGHCHFRQHIRILDGTLMRRRLHLKRIVISFDFKWGCC
jgi:hypothetical protein